ncbi:MAG: DegT/DnrJ/EryC1/StrS family aminotransferase, partial [Magnetococcales bacterium]|nr:DegT/DnrJ/EryC1/StrS family aminotransferase [Magnetococcales bacterium]
PGDEVITTPMTFIATSAAIMAAGAKPVFVDVEADTGNIDAFRIEAAITERTKAILVVHLYGLLCDMKAIRTIADRHNLKIIEDAAHCVEGQRQGIRPGQLADAAAFSFYATKNLTSGEGGAVVTDDKILADRLRLLRLHGMTKCAADRQVEGYQHWDMVTLGWKYNMDNIQAAILLPQMRRLHAKLARRHQLAELYADKLRDLSGVTLVANRPDTTHARHLYPILLPPGRRDAVITQLGRQHIACMVNYRAIHLTTYFSNALSGKPGDFPVAEQFGDRVLSLPFYPTMPEESVHRVADALKAIASQ